MKVMKTKAKHLTIIVSAIVVVIVVASGIGWFAYGKTYYTSKSISAGDKYFKSKDYKNAITSYEKALQVNSKDIDLMINLASAYRAAQDIDKAEEMLLKALSIDSTNVKAQRDLGLLYLSLDELENAEKTLQNLVALTPGSEDGKKLLVNLYSRKYIKLKNEQDMKSAMKFFMALKETKGDVLKDKDFTGMLESYAKLLSPAVRTDVGKSSVKAGDIDNDNIPEILVLEQIMNSSDYDFARLNTIALYRYYPESNSFGRTFNLCVTGKVCGDIILGNAAKDITGIFVTTSGGTNGAYVDLIISRNNILEKMLELGSVNSTKVEDINGDGILEMLELAPNPKASSETLEFWHKWDGEYGTAIVKSSGDIKLSQNPPPGSGEPKPVMKDEIKMGKVMIGDNEKAVISSLGSPLKISKVTEEYKGETTVYEYNFGTITFVTIDEVHGVYNITIDKAGIKGPRGVQVGDTAESVLSKFPDNRKGSFDKYLYGDEYGSREDYNYGRVTYEKGAISSIIYTNDFRAVQFNIVNNKVSKINIFRIYLWT